MYTLLEAWRKLCYNVDTEGVIYMFTIMVVEDDLALQRMMCAFLGLNGYQTIPAANGEEALDAIERVMPDLVIADVMMPVMDG